MYKLYAKVYLIFYQPLPGNRNLTFIGHLNEEQTKVDGFDEKGSFLQLIHYAASYHVIEALINESGKCSQKLGYECKQSRLFNRQVSVFTIITGRVL